MQSTTGPAGGSRARVIYHTPGKSFAWLHKDGSFADFQKALRVRLNIPKNEPLVVKQLDGDYTLDIETEEEYEAFCHFAKSASQLHISVNGGLRDQLKAGEVAVTSSSTNVPAVLPPNPEPRPPIESEDPTLGKRKASQITADPEAVPSVTQKRKKRRKVGPGQSISVVNNSAIAAEPPEPGPEVERRVVPGDVVPGDAARDAPSTGVVVEGNRSVISQAQKKKRKNATGQSDSTSADPVERRIEPSAEPVDAPEPTPAEPQRTKKRKKTVVLDLSTVIHPPSTTQKPPSTSTARQTSPVTGPSPSTTKEVAKKTPARKKAKASAKPSEPTPTTPSVPRPNAIDEPVASGAPTKPKPPVSKSGLPRPQVYVEIITKKRKTGKTDGTVEKETKQQELVKKPAQPTVGKPKGNPRKSKTEPKNRIDSPNAPNIQEIMDGVIAAAMENAKKRASTSGTTTDVSENFTPPPQNKSESTVRKPRLVGASSLEPASSTTLLDTTAPAPTTVGSASVSARKKVRTRKSRVGASPPLMDSDGSSLVSDIHHSLRRDPPALPSLLKNLGKPNAPLTAPPPNQKAMKKPSPAEKQPEEESTSSEDEDSTTPKKKPAVVSDPDDELDAFLHAPTHPSQKSVLEELPSDSEDEEEEVEREDMEVDEEDGTPKSKFSGHGRSKVTVRAGSSFDDDSDSESDAAHVLVKPNQVKVDTQVTHVSETRDIVPSSDLEDEGEPLSQPTKSTNIFTTVIPSTSSTPDVPAPHMTPISNLKSARQAFNFFNGNVLDKPDPIDDDSSRVTPPDRLPEDLEDPIENADTTSTPKPKLIQQMKGRNKIASPVVVRKGGAAPKRTQSSLTSPLNSMLPPPTPSRDVEGDLTFGQPLDQSTPAVSGISRKRQLISQKTVPGTPAQSTWATLPRSEPSTQSMDDPAMVDELVSSPTENTTKLPKATPAKRPISSGSTNRTPLFLPGTSQYPIPSSDLPAAEESPSEESEEEEKMCVPPSPRVLRSSTAKKTITPYRRLSVLASQRSIFPSTPIEPAPVTKSQAKPGSDDDDDEDSGVSDSDSDSPPPSHIPKGRRAGAGNGSRGKRSQLAMWS